MTRQGVAMSDVHRIEQRLLHLLRDEADRRDQHLEAYTHGDETPPS
jgi:hypothetical protein